MLKLHENLVFFRKQRKVTQSEVAQFLGVTKASVSKWETRQSYPDITLLPQLAAFYGVSVDTLIGYEPQLSRAQIQTYYYMFAKKFTEQPYEQVMAESEGLVQQYYDCYPFLFQMCVLWFNHVNLAASQVEQQACLQKIATLCRHISTQAPQVTLRQDALIFQAMLNLQLGDFAQVIEVLEPLHDPYQFSHQSEPLLIQAYQQAQKSEEAQILSQVTMFQHIMALVGNATLYLQVNQDKATICEATMQRIDCLIASYDLASLHPNSVAIYQYQTAITAMAQQQPERALKRLAMYVNAIEQLLATGAVLQGDAYFDRLTQWFADSTLGAMPVRDPQFILASSLQALAAPVFAELEPNPQYQLLKLRLTR